MALRAIVTKNQDILRKHCKPVTEFNEKLHILLDDMYETMVKANGYGLAAPQVGVLRRAFVMNTGDGKVEAVNPQISNTSGSQRDPEGCLSCPGEYGYVTRPMNCTLKAQDRYGNWFEMDLSALACRCACHENDHLDGKLFLDIADEMLEPEKD